MPGSHHDTRPQGFQIPFLPFLIFGVLSLASANLLLSMASLLVLALILKLLWRPGEPPILLLAMAYHWVQACILTLDAKLRGQTLNEMVGSQTVTEAAWLTLLGVLAVAVGMKVGAKKNMAPSTQPAVATQSAHLSVQRLFFGSLLAILLANRIDSIAYIIPGLSQPILALSNLHWVVVYLFTYTVLSQRQGHGQLATIIAIELMIGFLGYFSGFKNILFIVILAALAAPGAMRGVRIRTALAISVAVLLLAVVWVGIKKDYRLFLNMGSGDQVVLVPIGQRFDKLRELVGELTPQKLAESLEALSERLTYVKYFGESIEVVPSHIPHEGGKLWWEAIENVLVPRFLNPEKRAINDSERTSHYTGGWVAGVQEGTSISLGYIAESYIDFGPFLMFLPLFLWGYFLGWSYRRLVLSTPCPLFGYGNAAVLIYLNATYLESSNLKMLGGMVMGLLVLYLVQKYFAEELLQRLSLPSKPRISAVA